MGKRKYRLLPPGQVAESAWGALTKESKLREMKDNYVKKMDELPANADAKARYTSGVAGWTETMRTREVRETVMKAIGRAKSIFLAKRLGTAPPAPA
jgi:hypothetical protein